MALKGFICAKKTSILSLIAEGELFTWGSSSEGQTGQGDKDCVVPTKVHLRGKVAAVACGYYHMAVATGELQLQLILQLFRECALDMRW